MTPPVVLIAIAGLTIGCAGLVLVGVALLIEMRRGRLAMEMVLKRLNETHRMGFEVLVMDIDRLKDRVDALEHRQPH